MLGVMMVSFCFSARNSRIWAAVVPPSMKTTSPSLIRPTAALPMAFFSLP